MDEKELIRRSQEGDGEAFGQLIERYKSKVYYLAYGLTGDRSEADDLAQEVFIKAYYAIPKFQFKSEFGTWLYRIAVNHVRDYLRKNRHRLDEVSIHAFGESFPAAEGSSFEERQLLDKRRALVQAALRRLPEKYQIILALRDIQGLSYEEISRILGISAGTVDSRLHRARKKLREKLALVVGGKGGEYGLS
jgi:RNA polymerase sigma-70 factor (ECF subfamily)